MDQIKIGKFIADCRMEQGMTQRQDGFPMGAGKGSSGNFPDDAPVRDVADHGQ